jgi:DNA-binding transcriptional LysR family regulator
VPAPFVLSYVLGVTPNKWVGVWKERMPHQPIEIRLEHADDALHSLRHGVTNAALLRLPFDQEGLSVIPLYWEKPVAVVPKDHVLEAFEELTLADLADETVIAGRDHGTIELVAANVGVAIVPQSIARALSRKDVVARPISDAPETRIALAWVDGDPDPLVEEFIGIVRGRTANSSRGAAAEKPTVPTAKPRGKKVLPPKRQGKPKRR